jgi:hypothetical protein
MIRITRTVLSEELRGRLAALTKEVNVAEPGTRVVTAREIWKRSSTRTHVHGPLGRTLRDMALGLEQCMYCGEEEGTDIDHFEPLSRNPLRTFDWLNHLLACATCNSHKKRDQFPVDADGQPLLIDPTLEDPFDHLLLTLSLGHYEPLSEKGKATIEVCDLNRPLLERGRVRSRTVVEYCLRQWAAAHVDGHTAAMAKAVATVREQPFADVCQAMLRQAEAPGAEIIFADSPEVLGLLRASEVRSALLG